MIDCYAVYIHSKTLEKTILHKIVVLLVNWIHWVLNEEKEILVCTYFTYTINYVFSIYVDISSLVVKYSSINVTSFVLEIQIIFAIKGFLSLGSNLYFL